MDLTQVLHMNGGVEEASYANNSLIQREAISLTTSCRVKTITNLYCSLNPKSLAIADLGCSVGPNTLLVTSEIIKVVEKLCQELNHQSPEYKVFLNDLPGNDFNSIFKSLDTFKKKLRDEMETEIGPCYFSGVPGSFYCRIFPNKSLHFVHSSSEVKLEVETEGSFSINQLEVFGVNMHALDSDLSELLAKGIRAVIEPLLISHFSEGVTKEVFDRHRKILTYGISKERTKITNLTVTLTRKS
ncbi:S-adenosyl-L-methionine:benzoic acid/salicylic acid carboxyl methyltransferase 2-like [Vicia villosa]|uniref:S-adenosyl-L-methionine:benzoic acid/salicylic acid carboxyl methyltransferase 2-like n=1 Tax=Vicia villosa TaxID=3911 RepID=UPI00273BE686|nr:S-adenosyl-L-methionine:benzoic acid/salicylic acid carboxyl methyltransferase 2-like [Vicia villosa]